MSKLSQLKQLTTIVADTGDFESIAKYHPTDATTNPSLILQAAQLPNYASLIHKAVDHAKSLPKEEQLEDCLDKLMVLFGCEILKIVPGRVSTEVDAKLSYDTEKTIQKALKLIKMYEAEGIGKDRILIKIASTWEGIQAARVLESEHGIHCNLTLLFSFVQAAACAEAGATLISPFVGRILDWYKKAESRDYTPAEDPGVLSVKDIYNYLKHNDYKTIVMGASFRNSGEILELAGIDYLTISPKLLEELATAEGTVECKLNVANAKAQSIPKASYIENEAAFRADLEVNKMAHELLHDGIKRFDEDTQKLAQYVSTHFLN